jgi:hypothetical protein
VGETIQEGEGVEVIAMVADIVTKEVGEAEVDGVVEEATVVEGEEKKEEEAEKEEGQGFFLREQVAIDTWEKWIVY